MFMLKTRFWPTSIFGLPSLRLVECRRLLITVASPLFVCSARIFFDFSSCLNRFFRFSSFCCCSDVFQGGMMAVSSGDLAPSKRSRGLADIDPKFVSAVSLFNQL